MSEVDFDGYLNEQIGEPVEQPEAATEEVVAEEAPSTQPRDEAGRFASAAEEEQAESLILGKYKTTEDALKALEHSQQEIGRKGQEVGELRQQLAELQARYEQPQHDFSGIDDQIADNPHLAQQAAIAALDQGDQIAYERILAAWAEYDQFNALRFDQRVAAFQAQQQYAAQLQPQIDTAAQYAAREGLNQALGSVQSRHNDFAEVVGSLDDQRLSEIVTGGFPPALLQGLNGTKADKEAVFETLYRWVKAEQADRFNQATQNVVATQTAEDRQAKAQAAVATATSQPASETTSGDEELDEFYEFLRQPSPTNWLAGR